MKTIEIQEPLTILNIAQRVQELNSTLHSDDSEFELDLSNVDECDSAGVQLVISTYKTAKKMNKNISFGEISQAVQESFRCAGISDMNEFFLAEIINNG